MHRQASPELEPASVASETDTQKVETSSEALNTPSSAAIGSTSKLSKLNFPSKLHRILSSPEYSDIICWLPHGRSWRVMQQQRFEKEVLPLFFRHGRYASFARQINGWGFRRIPSGPDFNSYYHELFLRDAPELCLQMTRPSTMELADRKKEEPDSPPNFYLLPKVEPSKSNDEPATRSPLQEPPSVVGGSQQSATIQDDYMGNLIQRISIVPPQAQSRMLEVELLILRKQRQAVLEKMELLRLSRMTSDASNAAFAVDVNRLSMPASSPPPPLQYQSPHGSTIVSGASAFSRPMGASLAQRAAIELFLRNQIPQPQTGLPTTAAKASKNDARDSGMDGGSNG